jgi:hypothetical protein
MDAAISVSLAALAVFILSSIWYAVLTPVEARALGAAAIDRGRPSAPKVLVELLRSILVGAVLLGVAHTAHLHGVGSTVLLALALWIGFPLVLLTGSMMWDRVPAPTALLHGGDWLLKLVVISAIVGLTL